MAYSGSQPGTVLSPGDYLERSGDIFGFHDWRGGDGGAPCIYWAEARDAAEHPTSHRTVPHNEFSIPKCRQRQGWESLMWCIISKSFIMCTVFPDTCSELFFQSFQAKAAWHLCEGKCCVCLVRHASLALTLCLAASGSSRLPYLLSWLFTHQV